MKQNKKVIVTIALYWKNFGEYLGKNILFRTIGNIKLQELVFD